MNRPDEADRQPGANIPSSDETDFESGLYVVGLGASAGGLEAFERFFTNLPIDSNMAFVLIQHLDAEHVSILPELIARYTPMPVLTVTNDMLVEPNHLYVIPSNRNIALQQGKLILSKLEPSRGNRLPIDFFFHSLASDKGERAIGIVLSGTGSDGSQGIEAIRSAGGIVIAQSPESAAYDGMPKSALATGMVDVTLTPEAMPAELLRYSKTREPISTLLTNRDQGEFSDPLKKIYSLLYGLTRQDFSSYKQSTVIRQIERRMKLNFFNNLNEYVDYLKEKPEELQLLFSNLLIGVTRFFRDPDAFQSLIKQVVIPIIQKDPESEIPIRVWVPACSTGEEAYSVAIAFQEQLEAMKCHRTVQIYATDIDPQAVNQARAGVYRSQIQSDLTKERLQRFFTLDGNLVYVKKSIRDMVVFAVQNLIMDPPFSRLDLITCRNLLIYLEPETQKRIFPLFHYALNPHGYLFLGNAETTGNFVDYFKTLDRRNKIYQKKETAQAGIGDIKFRVFPGNHTVPSHLSIKKEESKLGLKKWTENALLDFFSPACVVTDEKFNVLYVQGHTSDYLEPPTGEVTNNVVKMARNRIKMKLSSALRKATSQMTQVQLTSLKYMSNNIEHKIRLTVKPFHNVMGGQTLILIVFEDLPLESKEKKEHTSASSGVNEDLRIAELEQELQLKENYILSTFDDLETANQEVKLVNQDLMSANEELQSTNEELETSKEELQSINEELTTVNTEVQRKNEELSITVNDLNNFLTSTEIATIFLNLDLQIRRFTPTINTIFNLLPGDIGRPIQHFVSNLAYDKMISDCRNVLDTLNSRTVEVQTHQGVWYLMNIRPYRTVENMIDGLVITFVDITVQKESEEARRLSVLLRDSNDAIVVFDFVGNIISWNQGATLLYGWSESEGLRMNIQKIIPPEKNDEMRKIIQRIAAGQKVNSFETERLARDGQRKLVWATMTVLFNESGKPIRIATTERDISERKQAERSMRFKNRALTSLQHWYRSLLAPTASEANPATLCQILVENAGYRLAWFGQVQVNGKPQVIPMAGTGLDKADLDMLEFSQQSTKASQTLIKTVIRNGRPAVVRDIFTEAENKPWRTEAGKLGYASFVVLPVPGKESDSPKGLLMVYAVEPDAFNTEELELLKLLVSDLSYSNNSLEKKKGY